MNTVRHIISGNKIRLHLVFCAVVLVSLSLGTYLLHFSGFRFKSIPYLFTDWLIFIACIYTGRWLCMRWYLRKKSVHFVAFIFSAVVLIAVLKWLMIRYLFGHPYAGFLEVARDTMPLFLIGLVLGMFLKLIRESMRKDLLDAQIKTEQKEIEFNVLQSQLSPHFLFNVLNNLYGISIEDHQRIPALLLKLSSLLRYSVYGSKKTWVPLKEEIEYIRNYIEFEQIRMSDRLQLTVDVPEAIDPGILVAPQVLIVFIENAFKHSKNSLQQKIEILIALQIDHNFISLDIINSYRAEKIKDEIVEESSGLGLPNTIRRLDLMYGDDYELRQDIKEINYEVNLRLKIRQ